MEKKDALVTASYLTTEEDYIHFRLAVHKGKLNRTEVSILRVVGFLMVIGGGVGSLLAGGGSFLKSLSWMLLVLLGLIAAFYSDYIEPYVLKLQGKNEYPVMKNRLVAQTIFFYEERMHVSTDRYEAELPYDLLYACAEDGKVFLFYTGMEEVRFVPKRAMSPAECESLRTLLRKKMGDRYLELKG